VYDSPQPGALYPTTAAALAHIDSWRRNNSEPTAIQVTVKKLCREAPRYCRDDLHRWHCLNTEADSIRTTFESISLYCWLSRDFVYIFSNVDEPAHALGTEFYNNLLS